MLKEANKKSNGFIFEKDAVKYLAELLNETGLNEVEYKCGEICIRFSKGAQVISHMPMAHGPQMAQMAQPQIQESSGTDNTKAQNQPQKNENFLLSPMVGKVYLASKPGAEPFVKIGSKVKEGDIICIVEAMKVMNNIRATKNGIVEEILVSDGGAVEYDQKIIRLKIDENN